MNNKSDLDLRQSNEVVGGQSEAQPNDRQLWTTPSLKIIDINEETELDANSGNDLSVFS